jgi:hypothetical protein
VNRQGARISAAILSGLDGLVTPKVKFTRHSSCSAVDIETVPDLKGFAAANGHDGKTDDEIRAAMGDKFPKHIYHLIICIGALVAHRDEGRWTVDVVGAPHIGDRSEKALICYS